MHKASLLIFAACLSINLFAQGKQSMIDMIKCKEDVQHFLNTIDPEQFRDLSIFKTDKTKNEYHVVEDCAYSNKYYKIDFDKDGLTDLIIDARLFLVIINKGNNTFQINYIDNCEGLSPGYSLRAIDTINKQLIVRKLNYKYEKTDTTDLKLIYKFNRIIEYNINPTQNAIRNIKIKFGECFGTCPVFEMSITEDRVIVYNAVNYNERAGIFKATISQTDWQLLCDLLNYINFEKLSERYSVNWTDDASATLDIHYNSNSVKHIQDYGQQGNLGLEAVYSTISSWRKTQSWQKLKDGNRKLEGDGWIIPSKNKKKDAPKPKNKYLID